MRPYVGSKGVVGHHSPVCREPAGLISGVDGVSSVGGIGSVGGIDGVGGVMK